MRNLSKLLAEINDPEKTEILFSNLESIYFEEFDKNYLASFHLNPKSIFISRCKQAIEISNFSEMTNLNELFISDSCLFIDENIRFKGQLFKISLNGTQLKEVNKNLFESLTSLEDLNLERNQISELKHGVFNNLTNLEILNLNRNEIINLDENCFEALSSLKVLSINQNYLKTSDIETLFGSLKNLGRIFLRENRFRNINSNIFQDLTKLEILDVSYNKIIEIDLLSFKQYLDLYLSCNMIKKLKSISSKEANNLNGFNLYSNRIFRLFH